MYCSYCGRKLDAGQSICPDCAARRSAEQTPPVSRPDRKIRFCWAAIPAMIYSLPITLVFLSFLIQTVKGSSYTSGLRPDSVWDILFVFLFFLTAVVLLFKPFNKGLIALLGAQTLALLTGCLSESFRSGSFDEDRSFIPFLAWLSLTAFVALFVVKSKKLKKARMIAKKLWWATGLLFFTVQSAAYVVYAVKHIEISLSIGNHLSTWGYSIVIPSVFHLLLCRWVVNPYKVKKAVRSRTDQRG